MPLYCTCLESPYTLISNRRSVFAEAGNQFPTGLPFLRNALETVKQVSNCITSVVLTWGLTFER